MKEIRKAISRGTLTAGGFCVAEGFHLLDEALRSGRQIGAVFAAEQVASEVEHRLGSTPGIRAAVLPPDLIRSISSTEANQGVVALIRPLSLTLDEVLGETSLVIVLDAIQDPGNAGTIVRSAEAFGATGVMLLKGSVDLYNPKALRASAGSIFRVPHVFGTVELLLKTVASHELSLFSAVPHAAAAIPVHHARLDRKCAILIGSEGGGVQERLRSESVDLRIPTAGVDCLNAAMAATVILYEARKQRMAQAHGPV